MYVVNIKLENDEKIIIKIIKEENENPHQRNLSENIFHILSWYSYNPQSGCTEFIKANFVLKR